MKFKLIAVLGAVAVVVSFTMPSFATSKVSAKSRTQSAQSAQSSVTKAASVATCTGQCTSCPVMNGATKASASVKAANGTGASCPVSDPSLCPASCQRSHAGAVAAEVKNR